MIDKLRKMHPNNHQAVLDMVISHQGLPHKMELVKRILSTLVLPAPVPYRSVLRRFAALSSKATADVAVRAQQLLVSRVPGSSNSIAVTTAAVPTVCFYRVHSRQVCAGRRDAASIFVGLGLGSFSCMTCHSQAVHCFCLTCRRSACWQTCVQW